MYGGWAVEEELIDIIYKLLPFGSTVLELGSGDGSTPALDEKYTVYSIEHNKDWIGKYDVNYIYAPLRKHKAVKNHEGETWYNAEVLRRELPGITYDLLLVDGPPGSRAGFIKYFDLFRHDVPIVVDDLQRFNSYKLAKSISNKLGKPFTVYGCYNGGKAFATFIP